MIHFFYSILPLERLRLWENIHQPVFVFCGHKRIQNDLPFFTLAGIECHHFHMELIVDFLRSRVVMNEAGNISLLLGMWCYHTYRWGRILAQEFFYIFDNLLGLWLVNVALNQ